MTPVLAACRGVALVAGLVLLVSPLASQTPEPPRQPAAAWSAAVAALSEPGGYFGTDNLISNERSYGESMASLDADGLAGGVYIGVGPDQNFSYIARLKPSMAYLVDIRRDNMLLHLLFKALFELADTRGEYPCLLVGCTVPATDRARINEMTAPDLASWVEGARRQQPTGPVPDPRLAPVIAAFSVPLSAGDRGAAPAASEEAPATAPPPAASPPAANRSSCARNRGWHGPGGWRGQPLSSCRAQVAQGGAGQGWRAHEAADACQACTGRGVP